MSDWRADITLEPGSLWNDATPVSKRNIDVPEWIDQEIASYDVAAILQGGCASGAYMPAVTYYDAARMMHRQGDEVLEYIEDAMGELPQVPSDTSWKGMAVFYLSYAVELWASSIEEELLSQLKVER